MRTAGEPAPPELLAADDERLAAGSELSVTVAQLAATTLLEDQLTTRAEIEAFVAAHADAAERSCSKAHLTGSALVVDATGTRTLLMLHRKLGRWFQPGGHADGNTNLVAVALREAGEETGIDGLRVMVPAIDVEIHRVEPPNEPSHLHLDVRHLVVAPVDACERANHESRGLRWVDEASLAALDPPVDPSTRRLVTVGLRAARRFLPSSPG